MFTVSLRTNVVIRMLLIAMIFFNALTSSTAFAQAEQESIYAASRNLQETERENRSIPTVERSDSSIAGSAVSQQTTNPEFRTSIVFIENVGQFDPRARFQSNSNGSTIYFSEDAIWFTLLETLAENQIEEPHKERARELQEENQKSRKGVNIKINLVGSNPHPSIESFNRITTNISYFTGHDQTSWRTDVPAWGGIRYVDIYPGMDLEIVSEQDRLVWQFTSTDPSRFYDRNNPIAQQGIRIKIAGHQKLQVQQQALDIATDVGALVLPVIRLDGVDLIPQLDNNGEITVPISNRTSISPDMFNSVSYIPSKETGPDTFASSNALTQTTNNNSLSLTADYLLLYSTFFGGSDAEFGDSITIDQNQNVYIAGRTFSNSSSFPITPGSFDTSNSLQDAFVAKIDLINNQVVYATYLGGSETEYPTDIKVDGSGNIYITGFTFSSNFPNTPGVLDSVWDHDSFVTKLNASGNQLIYSTFLGGTDPITSTYADDASSIGIDDEGFAYISGATRNSIFADTTIGYDLTHNGGVDIFVTKINPTATQQVYFTYIGGNDHDDLTIGSDLALDANGAVYLTGTTRSSNFPTTPGAYDTSYNPGNGSGNFYMYDSFAVKIDPSGESLNYSTFLGGNNDDEGVGIAVDNNGFAYVALGTSSSDFLITTAIGPNNNPTSNSLVTKLNPTGSNIVFSTHMSDYDWMTGVSVDSQGYICYWLQYGP